MRLYIDPGTGSMLFTVLIAVLGSLVYVLRSVKIRLGAMAHRDRTAKKSTDVSPLVIYSDHKRYWTTFAPICEELNRRGQDTLYLTQSEDDPVFRCGLPHIHPEYIGEGNKAFARLNFLRARVLFSTTPSLDVYQWKRSRDVSWYVHIQHSCSDVTRYRMFGIDYYDAILLSGQYQIDQVRALEKLRNLPEKETRLVGVPYMDEMKKRLDAAPTLENAARTVMLAPSWGESGILSRYGHKMIDALLKTGYHIIIRPHPQSFESERELMEELMREFPDSGQLEWNRDNDNFEALRRSDILISDFSGVIFDFTFVFDKPVLYADTSFDKGPYDCWWLEDELWTFRILPEIGVHITEDTLPELRTIMDRCIEDPAYQAARDRARQETWVQMGAGAKNTVDYLISKIEELEGKSKSDMNNEEDGGRE